MELNDEAQGWIKALLTHASLANANTPQCPDTVATQLLCVIRCAGNAYGALQGHGSGAPVDGRYGKRVGDELEGLAIAMTEKGVIP